MIEAALLLAVGVNLRVAVFRADVTPARGEPLIWVTPVEQVLDPLQAKGVVIEASGKRYVLCAMDWCGLSNSARDLFRKRIADAAQTGLDSVALQTVHQHTAPYVDGDAYELLDGLAAPPLRMSRDSLAGLSARLGEAVRAAVFEPFDSIGTGEAAVERVASARRLPGPNGRIIVRYSTGGRSREMAEAPEGPVDRRLKTVTFARGSKPIVRLHYYATHPQTFCCDGRVSADFVGAAREAFEREDGAFQVYFTGCAGDVTVGKYNNTSDTARQGLMKRLLAGMRAAAAATTFRPVKSIEWRTASLELPPKADSAADSDRRARLEHPDAAAPDEVYRSAISSAFADRSEPLDASALHIAEAVFVHLPGEPMLEFQKYAQSLAPSAFVAVAGYGDLSPGYLCTDRAFREGGYEPGASNAGPGTEAAVKEVLRKLVASEPR
jgi:hypothetical protein